MSASELNVAKYIGLLRRWWWLLALTTTLGAVSSFFISSHIPKTYLASLTLIVGDDTANLHPSVEDVTVSQRLAAVYAGMITREPILTATVSSLKLPTTWFELQRRVLVIRTDGSQLIEVRVTDSDPARTRATVDEIAHQLTLQSPTAENSEELDRRREFVRQQLERLQVNIQDAETRLSEKQAALASEPSARGVLDLQDEIKALELNLTNWRASYASMLATNVARSPNTLTVIQPSLLPDSPVGPNLRANVVTGAALGLLLGLAAVVLIEFLRGERAGDPDDISRSLGLNVLSTVGKIGRTATVPERLMLVHAPHSAIASDYRRLRTNVQFAWGQADRPITLLVTSPGPQEGKSLTSANLAVAFARGGLRTVLVDVDLARPAVHTFFDLPNDRGLTSLLWSDAVDAGLVEFDPRAGGDLAHVLRRRLDALLLPSGIPGLRVLTAGSTLDEPADLVTRDDLDQLLDALGTTTDVIILDGPPVLAAAETLTLATLDLSVLLILAAGITRMDAARLANEVLHRASARVLGVVLNRATVAVAPYYQSYRGANDKPDEPLRRRAAQS